MKKYQGIWRTPGTRTAGFPKLMVDDNVVSGSINVRDTRLPLWAIIFTVINEGWDAVEMGWSPQNTYGYSKQDLTNFLYCLLEQRGEFGRLLLSLANAENSRRTWWENKTTRHRVINQLKRCLSALEQVESDIELDKIGGSNE